jgi:hypothetical protein
MMLCYLQLEDGSEFLFLLTYTTGEKALSFTFPSGRMFLMKSTGVTESANPDFQFMQYDDLHNNISINSDGSDMSQLIEILCTPYCLIGRLLIWGIGMMMFPFMLPYCNFTKQCDEMGAGFIALILAMPIVLLAPLLLIYTAYQTNSNLKLISILFALYFYSCLYAVSIPVTVCNSRL